MLQATPDSDGFLQQSAEIAFKNLHKQPLTVESHAFVQDVYVRNRKKVYRWGSKLESPTYRSGKKPEWMSTLKSRRLLRGFTVKKSKTETLFRYTPQENDREEWNSPIYGWNQMVVLDEKFL